MKIAGLVIATCLLGACDRSQKAEVHRDAEQLRKDVKRGYEKADKVVTKELEKAREKVREETKDVKRDYERRKAERDAAH
jgi:hypothetical protein